MLWHEPASPHYSVAGPGGDQTRRCWKEHAGVLFLLSPWRGVKVKNLRITLPFDACDVWHSWIKLSELVATESGTEYIMYL
jgi:hypothetical protein